MWSRNAARSSTVWPLRIAVTIGAVVGTVAGARVLKRIAQPVFRRVIAVLLFVLCIYMIRAGGKQD